MPKYLVIEKYFATEKTSIEKFEEQRNAITQQLTELEEEHGDEDGLLADAKNDMDKVTKATVQKRLKEVKGNADFADEVEVLETYLKLIEEEAAVSKKVKDVVAELDKKVLTRYKSLTSDEIKVLVVDDKWMTTIETDIKTEIERISQRLSQRIKELAERYEAPMPKIVRTIDDLESKVSAHLQKMGFKW